ncbi:hypothetical protein IMY05_008G0114200 [Salix suchowensis]|nr:hypothetical protein IMY05_008G0114200 [Salix suchowensis]
MPRDPRHPPTCSPCAEWISRNVSVYSPGVKRGRGGSLIEKTSRELFKETKKKKREEEFRGSEINFIYLFLDSCKENFYFEERNWKSLITYLLES